eukprot:Amastigsp_a176678_22.p4 type:complete len:117 gc:universal Amastigsp_a176678_22:281-631(+)
MRFWPPKTRSMCSAIRASMTRAWPSLPVTEPVRSSLCSRRQRKPRCAALRASTPRPSSRAMRSSACCSPWATTTRSLPQHAMSATPQSGCCRSTFRRTTRPAAARWLSSQATAGRV